METSSGPGSAAESPKASAGPVRRTRSGSIFQNLAATGSAPRDDATYQGTAAAAVAAAASTTDLLEEDEEEESDDDDAAGGDMGGVGGGDTEGHARTLQL